MADEPLIHKPKGNHRTMLLVGGGAILLYLLYRWYSNNSTSNASVASSTGTVTPYTGSSDGSNYASLAGQEQGDVATLSGQISTLTGQEQSDVSTLTGNYQTLTNQEQSDVQSLQSQQQSGLDGITGTISSLSDTLSSLGSTVSSLSGQVAGLTPTVAATATGTTKTRRPTKLPPATTTARSIMYPHVQHTKPPAKAGYVVRGLGHGYWEYAPVKKHVPAKHPAKHPVRTHPHGKKR